jgi:thiamine transport system permease protein
LFFPASWWQLAFTVFRNVHDFWIELGLTFLSDPVYWIIAAHVFVNYSIAVRTIGGVWAGLDTEIDEAAELDGAGRLRSLLAVSLPQLRPAIFSAAALVFCFLQPALELSWYLVAVRFKPSKQPFTSPPHSS